LPGGFDPAIGTAYRATTVIRVPIPAEHRASPRILIDIGQLSVRAL
jgi:hypothetical protein